MTALLTRIDHVGIAVRDVAASLEFYVATFGLEVVADEVNEEQGVHEVMLRVQAGAPALAPSGGSYVQLLEPTREDSPVGSFLARRGEGIHHVAYGVDDVEAAMAAIGATGVRLVDLHPRHGAMGSSIAFLHPKDVGGVLTELVQANPSAPA